MRSRNLDAANYRAIEKLRDGRNYIIRAQRRDDNIIDALHLRAGLRSFYLRFLTRKHRLNNFEAGFTSTSISSGRSRYWPTFMARSLEAPDITSGHRGRPTSPLSLATLIKTKASPQRCCIIWHSSPAMPVSPTFTRIPCRTIGRRCAYSISWAFPAPPRTSAT